MTTISDHPFPTQANADTGSKTPSTADSGLGTGAPDVLQRVVQGAHQTIDRLAETAAPHVHRLQESVHSASDKLHERGEQARDMSDEWADSLRTTVRENPLAAVAAAVVVGLLVARITR